MKNSRIPLADLQRSVKGARDLPESTLASVQNYLFRFGFVLQKEAGVDAFTIALERFREYYAESYSLKASLNGGPPIDESVLRVMGLGQCGLFRFDQVVSRAADMQAGKPVVCKWNKKKLKYKLGAGIPGSNGDELIAVQAMLDKWQGLGRVSFAVDDTSPDFEVAWKTADQDFDMTGVTIAHAGIPNCSSFPIPLPLHFDNEETWGGIGYNINGVALHEIGHILGLFDSPTPGTVMHHVFMQPEPDRQFAKEDQDELALRYP